MADWTSDLKVADERIDAEHAEIFRRLAALADALTGPAAAIEPAVAALADALVTHLASEEQLMEEALYPERARHKSAHELFMADFLQMRETLASDGATPTVADWVTRRIPEWLRFHISVNDLPLGIFLARRRAQQAGGRPTATGGKRPS